MKKEKSETKGLRKNVTIYKGRREDKEERERKEEVVGERRTMGQCAKNEEQVSGEMVGKARLGVWWSNDMHRGTIKHGNMGKVGNGS